MRRVFVVEDEAVVALELQDHLRAHGYEVCGHAARGEAALRQIPEARPDLVLMDINLGEGMTGLDVAERLRGVIDVPVIFLTAYSDAEITARAGRSGSFAYIVKPFDPLVLRANIELALVRHDAMVAVRESEMRFRALFEQAAVGVAESDAATGRILRVNRRYGEIMGYSEAELLALDFMTITHTDDIAMGLAVMERFRRGELREFSLEKRYIRKDGSTVWAALAISALWAPGEAPTCYMAVVKDITERKLAEAALRKSEAFNISVLDSLAEHIAVLDEQGVVVAVNKAWRRFADTNGAPPRAENFIGVNYFTVCAQAADRSFNEAAAALAGIRAVMAGEQAEFHLEYSCHSPDEQRWFLMHVIPLQGSRGGVVISHENITSQHQHDATLRVLSTGLSRFSGQVFFAEVAAQLAAIVGAEIGFVGTLQPGPVPRIRTLGFIVDGAVSPPIEYPLRGTPCEQVMSGRALVFPAGVQPLFPEDQDLVALGVEGYAAAPLLDASGDPIGHVGVMTRRPIAHPERTESIVNLFALRTAAELERQRAEERFAGVFEFAPDALLMVDEAGRIVLANRMAEETLGYSRDELLRLTVEDLVPEDERDVHVAQRAGFLAHPSARRMGSARSRLSALRKDGTRVPVEISLSPLHSEEGRVVVAAVRDVSKRVLMEEERALLEDQLRQAQKMDSLGTLAGGIAHDFNNLLTVIAGSLELARGDAAPGDPVIESLDRIAAAASRAGDLVKQILAFSRRQPSSRTVTSVRTIVEEVARLLRATLPAGIQIVTDVGGELPSVLIDPTQIHQVLMNLGTNAWHAIERTTGKITFHLDVVSIDAGPPSAVGAGPGRYARIQVTDDGMGMDAVTRERIFEPFFTTKGVGKGTGLGLAVVHGIVAGHGGAITVDSAPGRGTTFSVYLPETAGQSSSPEGPEQQVRQGGGRVLLIEDEESVLRVARHLMERLGYEATGFLRAAEALDAVRADPGRFDVVLTDQNMPEMGGLEVARAIAALRSDLPVVMTSGNRVYTDDELAAGNVRYFLNKPYSSAALGQVLDRALRRS